jgi:hypothetical protein
MDILARLELRSRESDLLVEQQGELEAELTREGQLTLTTAESEAPAPAVKRSHADRQFLIRLQTFMHLLKKKMKEAELGEF